MPVITVTKVAGLLPVRVSILLDLGTKKVIPTPNLRGEAESYYDAACPAHEQRPSESEFVCQFSERKTVNIQANIVEFLLEGLPRCIFCAFQFHPA